MNKQDQHRGRFAAAVLAVSLAACGSIQGASSARAGTPAEGTVGAIHLTEFDVNDTKSQAIDPAVAQAIALAEKNEQQRLAQQGANAAQPSVSSPGGGSAMGGPALVP